MSNGNGKPKLCVIGLDSVPVSLLRELANDLPNIKKMLDGGFFATLESCHPPITVPAWMVMMSSKSPGRLGVYGFRHRKGFSYNEGWMANSQSIKEPRLWEYLAKDGKTSCLVGVPPTYPPIQVNGCMVSCFITPKDGTRDFTYPVSLGEEIQEAAGGNYMFDVAFRTEDRDEILRKLYEMTDKRFEVIKHLLKKEPWDYFMFVEIGVDRLHHMFWKFYDKTHPKYVPNNKYENAIPDYYKHIDQKIGEILSMIDDDTYVLMVSDHGTASMKGAFCINEWLIKEGYLVLKNYPPSVTDLDKCDVDWEKTTAWGWGGYYARIYLNVKGRERTGTVSMQDFDKMREELKGKLATIAGPNGEAFDNKVFYPEELYDECNGAKPDLMVYFDNLFWRSAGTIGHSRLHLSENDTGPDDSVHWMDGIFVLYNKAKAVSTGNDLGRLSIYDVAPTILDLMGSSVPKDMQGKIAKEICKWVHNS
jgi:predicted AlkP superfamily phosphohydrolase/phosphomutase